MISILLFDLVDMAPREPNLDKLACSVYIAFQ
jgi:hypothetical protein